MNNYSEWYYWCEILSFSNSNGERNVINLERKLNVIKYFENKIKIHEISKKINFVPTTLRINIIENKDVLYSNVILKHHRLFIAETVTWLNIWCDNQLKVNRCSLAQHKITICNVAELIFNKLKTRYKRSKKLNICCK